MLKNRIKKVRNYLNISSAKKLADEIKMPDYQLKDIESGKTKTIKIEYVEKLEEKFFINGWWLLTGKGEMLLSEKKDLSINGNENVTLSGSGNSIDRSFNMKKKKKNNTSQEETNELVSIPYLQDTYAAAGHGAINYDEVPHPMSFDKSFLQRQFGIVAVKNLHIINAIGNSMEPTIKEGELLMVNPFENESMHIKDGGIYVMSCNNSILVKRIKHNPISGNLTLISDNKEYDDIPVSKEEFKSCHIIGRVVGHFDKI